jgi:hypothetical protein
MRRHHLGSCSFVELVDVVVVVEVEDDALVRLHVIVVDDVTSPVAAASECIAGSVSVRHSSTTRVDDDEVEDVEEEDMAGPSLPLRGIALLSSL